MENIILQVVNNLHESFRERPYEFVSMEIEAQTMVANELKKYIKDSMSVNVNDSIPKLENTQCSRVRMEWSIDNNKNDVLVFKNKQYESWPKSYLDVEAAIEIKTGWDCKKDHFEHPTITKDFEFVGSHAEIGYLIVFLANNLSDMTDNDFGKDYYKDTFTKKCSEYKIKKGHAFYIFRDEILISQ